MTRELYAGHDQLVKMQVSETSIQPMGAGDSDTDSLENDTSPHWRQNNHDLNTSSYNPGDLMLRQGGAALRAREMNSPLDDGPVFQKPKEGSLEPRFVKRSFKAPGGDGDGRSLAGFGEGGPGQHLPPGPAPTGKRNIKNLRAEAERRASMIQNNDGMIRGNVMEEQGDPHRGLTEASANGPTQMSAGVAGLYEQEPSYSNGSSQVVGVPVSQPYNYNDPGPPQGQMQQQPYQSAAQPSGPIMTAGGTIVEADIHVVSDSSSEEDGGEENRRNIVQQMQQQPAAPEPRVAASEEEDEPSVSTLDRGGVGRSMDVQQNSAMHQAGIQMHQGNPMQQGMRGHEMSQVVQQQQRVPVVDVPPGHQLSNVQGGNTSPLSEMSHEVNDAGAQHQAALEDMQKCLETMRTSAPAPNTTVVRNGKIVPILHAARPIHMPPERFGSSIHMRKDFVMQPLPFADRLRTLQARVVRVRDGWSGKLFPTYHLCIRNGPGADETILLAAQKQTGKRSLSSYYLITLDPRCFQKGASTYVAKLRANFSGTEYTLFSDGDNPKKVKSLRGSESTMFDPSAVIREEMLAIKFSKPGNAPRRMGCVIPGPSPNNPYERQIFRSKPYTSLINYATGKEPVEGQDGIRFLKFHNKVPVWDARRQTFTINFYGRVRLPSSKNFQLVESEGEDAPPVVQFGRWFDDVFHLDGMWPFSVVQVFALALSTFDTRLQETFKMTY